MKVWKTLMLQRKHPVKHQLLEHFQRIPTVMYIFRQRCCTMPKREPLTPDDLLPKDQAADTFDEQNPDGEGPIFLGCKLP